MGLVRNISLLLLSVTVLTVMGCPKVKGRTGVQQETKSVAEKMKENSKIITNTPGATKEKPAPEVGMTEAGLPQEVPVYPGAKLLKKTFFKENGSYQMAFQTEKTLKEVRDWYKDQLTKAGWSQLVYTSVPESVNIIYGKDEPIRNINILINSVPNTKGKGKTTIVNLTLLYDVASPQGGRENP